MSDIIESYCGVKCSKCEYKDSCKGCIKSKGKLAWGECPLALCAIEKGKRFCGECEEFPCDKLKNMSFDKEHGDNGERIENCKQLKSEFVKNARIGIEPISYCGHHCDYCFLGKWCGGCRSDYNCCSFATISKDGICPNVKCCKGKGYDGCFECENIYDCTVGYYGNKDEYIAKATALFIKKHGKDKYTAALKNAINNGLNYPKSFDSMGSVEEALKLLEKYLINE